MDEAVKLIATALLLAAGTLGAARAEPLADPTRPPPSAGAAGAVASAQPARPVLQSVLIARQRGGRQLAVIDGETVRLGQSFHGAVLVRISETEVELRRGAGRQVLKLFAAAKPAP